MEQSNRKAPSFFASFGITCVASALAAFVVGCVYGVAEWYSPFAPLNVALTIAVACVIGWMVANIAIARVMTSRIALCAAGILAGLVALYASWGTNAAIRFPGVVTEGFSPRFLTAYAHELYAYGSIEIEDDSGDIEFKGTGLLVLWIVEASIVAVGGAVAATKCFQIFAPPMCKECRVWKSEETGILRCGIPQDMYTFADNVGAGDFSCLDDLPDGSIDDDPHIRFDVGWCSSCNDNCVASVSVVSYSSTPCETRICHQVDISSATLRKLHTKALD